MTISKRAMARPLIAGALALLTCGVLSASAWAAEPPPNRGRIVGKSGEGLAPVSGAADERTCTAAGNSVVTRSNGKFCGKPLDAAGEAACLKAGNTVVVIDRKKFCEPKAAAPAAVTPRTN